MRPHRLGVAAVAGAAVLGSVVPASASTWTVGLSAAARAAEAMAQPPLAAPGSVTATCSGLATVKVAWASVNQATSYSVYKSTTSSSSGYVLAASGIATTSWTSPALGSATYWFEVVDYEGSNWASANSSPAGPRTIVLVLCS